MSTELDRSLRAAPRLLFDELCDLAEAMTVEGDVPDLSMIAARVPDVPIPVLDGHLRLWEALRRGRDDAREAVRATLALRLVRLLEAGDQARPVRPSSDPSTDPGADGPDAERVDRLERRLRTAATHASTLAARLARQEALTDAWRERCRWVREQLATALDGPGTTLEFARGLVSTLETSLDREPVPDSASVTSARRPAAAPVEAPSGSAVDAPQVERAAHALAAAGDAVSIEAVGAKLGGGDVLEIARHLERWRERVGPLEVIGFGVGALELADELMRICTAGGERAFAAERAAASEARAALDRERALTSAAVERVRVLESQLRSVEQSARVARSLAGRTDGASRDEAVSSLTAQNAALRLQLEVLQAERSRLQSTPAQGPHRFDLPPAEDDRAPSPRSVDGSSTGV